MGPLKAKSTLKTEIGSLVFWGFFCLHSFASECNYHWEHCSRLLVPEAVRGYFQRIGSLCSMISLKMVQRKVRENSRECYNHKPQPFPDPKRKRKPTNPNKHKSNKRTKSTKISSLFPKRGNRNTKRIEKHKNKMTHEKT